MKVSGQRHAPTLPRKRTPVPLNTRLDGPQSRSGRFGEESFVPARIRNPDHVARSLFATLTFQNRRKTGRHNFDTNINLKFISKCFLYLIHVHWCPLSLANTSLKQSPFLNFVYVRACAREEIPLSVCHFL